MYPPSLPSASGSCGCGHDQRHSSDSGRDSGHRPGGLRYQPRRREQGVYPTLRRRPPPGHRRRTCYTCGEAFDDEGEEILGADNDGDVAEALSELISLYRERITATAATAAVVILIVVVATAVTFADIMTVSGGNIPSGETNAPRCCGCSACRALHHGGRRGMHVRRPVSSSGSSGCRSLDVFPHDCPRLERGGGGHASSLHRLRKPI
mmetsp:Transcript_29700/g.74254  ORF Transcript_29700/g.74254 Transcript_29700/m.74254 type:complete len:208 (-) Transcript_29700:166-789(-)